MAERHQDEFFDGRLAPMIETNRGVHSVHVLFGARSTTPRSATSRSSGSRTRSVTSRGGLAIVPRNAPLDRGFGSYGMYERDVGYRSTSTHAEGVRLRPSSTRPPEQASPEHVGGAGSAVLVLYHQAVQSLDEVRCKVKRQARSSWTPAGHRGHDGRGLRSNSRPDPGPAGRIPGKPPARTVCPSDSNINQMAQLPRMLKVPR